MNEEIILKDRGSLVIVERRMICSIQKENSRVKIITSPNVYYSGKTLKKIEEDLGKMFFRVRNDVIINMSRIDHVNVFNNTVFMDNGKQFVVAKRRKKEFVDVMKRFCCNLC